MQKESEHFYFNVTLNMEEARLDHEQSWAFSVIHNNIIENVYDPTNSEI